MSGAGDKERIEGTRVWLSSYFADEEGWSEDAEATVGLAEWFDDLAEYVQALPIENTLLQKAAIYMRPVTDGEPGFDCLVMYFEGAAVHYLEDNWGGDFHTFFAAFVEALGKDYEDWTQGRARFPRWTQDDEADSR